jgi:hypothetical protein
MKKNLVTPAIIIPCFFFSSSNGVQPVGRVTNILLINPKSDIFRVDEGYAETSLFRKYEFGVSSGFGFQWSLDDKTYLFAKNDLEYRKSLINSRYILDFQRVYSWIISAGVGI